MRRLPLSIAACVALVAIAGCSDDGSDADTPATTAAMTDPTTVDSTVAPTTAGDVSPSTAATTVAASTTVADAIIDIENQPGEGEFEGAVDDVTFECTAADGVWTASGAVTNSGEAPAGYRIFMSFLDDTGETVALVEADDDLDDVAPGEERDWSVSFESTATALDCVPRVERRPA